MRKHNRTFAARRSLNVSTNKEGARIAHSLANDKQFLLARLNLTVAGSMLAQYGAI